jgi:type IV pilus assembly protein PilM
MATKTRPGPRIACELSQERVIAARLSEDTTAIDSYTARNIAEGALVPRLSEANLANGDAVRQAVTDALTTVGSRSRDVITILPDGSARVYLLDFDSFPEKRQDADGVVRFRLNKVIPFEVEDASVSYQSFRNNGKVRVVAAVVLKSVLAEYEGVFRDLGYSPGVVIPSSLAALGNVESSDPTMVIKADTGTTTLAIVGGGELLLYRTLENAHAIPPTAEQLVPDVHASLVFFEDSYNMRVDRILVGGLLDAEQVGATLQQQTEISVQNLVASRHVGSARTNFPASTMAGVVGALLG